VNNNNKSKKNQIKAFHGNSPFFFFFCYRLLNFVHRGFAEDAEEEEEEEDQEEGEENTVQDIEANLNKSGDANLLNVEAEKMAFEDASKFFIFIFMHKSKIVP
jgi:hypothetical protein